MHSDTTSTPNPSPAVCVYATHKERGASHTPSFPPTGQGEAG